MRNVVFSTSITPRTRVYGGGFFALLWLIAAIFYHLITFALRLFAFFVVGVVVLSVSIWRSRENIHANGGVYARNVYLHPVRVLRSVTVRRIPVHRR